MPPKFGFGSVGSEMQPKPRFSKPRANKHSQARTQTSPRPRSGPPAARGEPGTRAEPPLGAAAQRGHLEMPEDIFIVMNGVLLLAYRGKRPRRLLNILQCTRKSLLIKNYPIQNPSISNFTNMLAAPVTDEVWTGRTVSVTGD